MVRCTKIMAETTEIEMERTIGIINQGAESLEEKESKTEEPQPKESKVRSKLTKLTMRRMTL